MNYPYLRLDPGRPRRAHPQPPAKGDPGGKASGPEFLRLECFYSFIKNALDTPLEPPQSEGSNRHMG
jgi:hypothetical protein